jgi:CSLREA domain-containing protein
LAPTVKIADAETGGNRILNRTSRYLVSLATIFLLLGTALGGLARPAGAEPSYPDTFQVNTGADVADVNPGDGLCDIDSGTSGEQCTLRAAIQESNITVGAHDTITFRLGNTIPIDRVIGIASALPEITDPVDILGPNYTGASIILDGGGGAYNGLEISAGSSTVRKIIIRDFGGHGIYLHGNGSNVIAASKIGPFGLAALADEGNDLHGIHISGGVGNVIGSETAGWHNIISGNGRYGINIENAATNLVLGNYIGTDSAGTAAIGNGWGGVNLRDSISCTIGGVSAGRRNLISGNLASGISISGGPSNGNQIRGNYIGTDVTGTVALGNADNGIILFGAQHTTIGGPVSTSRNIISGNGSSGIKIQDKSSAPAAVAHDTTVQGNYIGTDVTGTAGLGNVAGISISGGYSHTIGGTTSGAGNVIAGNSGHGLLISNADTDDIDVQGNYIGVDVSGSSPLGNGADGIHIERSPANRIGGETTGAGNVIAANAGDGIEVAFSEATSNLIEGNFVGTDAARTASMGNGGHGINLTNNAGATTIGGVDSGQGNTIAFNKGNGVTLCFACVAAIRGNAIWYNVKLGIDIGNNGPHGPKPELDEAVRNGSNTTLWGAIWGNPGERHELEVFGSSTCDPSGFGEGETLVTTEGFTLSGSGSAVFALPLGDVSGYGCLTATATAPNGSTSEFSNGLFLGHKVFLPLIRRQ